MKKQVVNKIHDFKQRGLGVRQEILDKRYVESPRDLLTILDRVPSRRIMNNVGNQPTNKELDSPSKQPLAPFA